MQVSRLVVGGQRLIYGVVFAGVGRRIRASSCTGFS